MNTLPDSGSRTQFTTGGMRDASLGKGLPSRIPPEALRRLAQRYEDGEAKYPDKEGIPNWMRGIPLSRYYDAIQRHSQSAAEGCTKEDHLAAVLWNAAGWIWTETAIALGELPASLDDLPFRRAKAASGDIRAAFERMMRDEPAEEAPEYLQEHNLPEVPRGYHHWEDRGVGWATYNRETMYAVHSRSRRGRWLVSGAPAKATGYDTLHYLEAVEGSVNVGDRVKVSPIHDESFEDKVSGIRHVRGTTIYSFSSGRDSMEEGSIYSISPLT